MNRARIRRLAGLAPMGVVLAGLAGAGLADEGPGASAPEAIVRGGEEVRVGLYLVDFARFNAREESFDMSGYLIVSWVEPTLATGESVGRQLGRDGVWMPPLEFINAVDQVKFDQEGPPRVSGDGRVVRWVRFSGKFSSATDLGAFPFDRQRLVVALGALDPEHDARPLRLAVDRKFVGQSKFAFLTDWEINGLSAAIEPRREVPPGGPQEVFVFTIQVARRSTFYVFRVLLPLTLLVVASWVVFWFEPTNIQPQISSALSIVLSLVVFNFTIDFALPKVPYLTFVDRHGLLSFGFVLAVVFAVTVIHLLLQRRGLDAALAFQRKARLFFPVAYLMSLLLNVAATFLR